MCYTIAVEKLVSSSSSRSTKYELTFFITDAADSVDRTGRRPRILCTAGFNPAVVVGGPDHKGHHEVATVSYSLLKDAFPKQAPVNKFHPSLEGNIDTGTPLKVAPDKKELTGQLCMRGRKHTRRKEVTVDLKVREDLKR